MKTRNSILSIALPLLLAASISAQDAAETGFIISLKNGSTIRGRQLARDEATGKLRLTMTESDTGSPKSYAIIAMDDAEAIRAPASDTDSIRIKLKGGSELRCKEFGLSGEMVTVKLGTASRIEVRWEDIESITFGQ
ncbi:MAG TPA: hypothetical protein VNO14_08300 [Blastocatellia bacterium]|nr:hypothetical protein [Blastocatellia bacterium]